MKKNNRGWGTLEMILLCCGLLASLLVAIYFISKLYGSLDISTSKKHYLDLESELETAARRYIYIEDIEVNHSFKISLSTLKDTGYITEFVDHNKNDCDGYVTVSVMGRDVSYKSYIKCADYETSYYNK